ncbi:aldo/keto reductase [Burkholderia sp. 22313]|uniref:aldo/keto reductase n=1 Tax=Burkholderia sp. 22313 TaxID=3453908 RepID=UPI003F833E62
MGGDRCSGAGRRDPTDCPRTGRGHQLHRYRRRLLLWPVRTPRRASVTSVIVGAKRVEQLEDNLGAVDVGLTDDELARLDAVSALPPGYPGWMIDRQAAGRVPEPFTPVA